MQRSLSLKVVVVTYKRLELLQKLVSSLKSCVTSKLSLEYIFIINGEDQNTKNYLEQNSLRHDSIIQTSPAAARNKALENINEDYILFIDDDVTLPEDYFQKLERYLNEYAPDVLGGPEIFSENANSLQKAYGFCQAHWFVTGSTFKRHQVDNHVNQSATETDLILCNLCIKADIFKEGFLFAFDFLRNEENELLYRLEKAGKKIVRVGKLFVYHEKKQSIEKIIKACKLSGNFRIQTFKKHPKSLGLQFLVPLITLAYFVNLFFFADQVLLMPLQLYLLVCFLISIKALNESKDFIQSLWIIIMIPIIHLSYAFGLMQGLLIRPSAMISK